jgi:farnesyl diphosphate synthase
MMDVDFSMPKLATQTATLSPLPAQAPAVREWSGLKADQKRVDEFLSECFEVGDSRVVAPVTLAMRYSVLGEAQRIRPVLALRLARMVGTETSNVMRAAAATEILHCASLIVDDLPSMDNELMRRGKPATHIQFGEATATLAAFSLVAYAARLAIEGEGTEAECQQLRRFQISLLRTLDVGSLVGGQLLDLELAGTERERLRETVNDLKTVPLFQLAVEAGFVSAKDGLPRQLQGFGRAFGRAFQLTDDYLDGELTDSPQDRFLLTQQYDRCRETLAPYGSSAQPVLELVDYLESRIG